MVDTLPVKGRAPAFESFPFRIGEIRNASNFDDLVKINKLFSMGHDGFQAARFAYLRSQPADAHEQMQRWNINPHHIQVYSRTHNDIERLISGNQAIDLKQVQSVKVNDVVFIEAYIVSELARIAGGMQTLSSPDRLERIAKFASLFPFGKADIDWGNVIPITDSLGSMASCLKDVALWQKYPILYSFLDEAALAGIGVDSADRYNIEKLTNHLRQRLLQERVIDKYQLQNNQVRVVAGVKPLSSLLATTVASKNMSIDQFADILMRQKQDHSLLPTVEKIQKEMIFKYDRYRVRVQTRSPKTFDQVGQNIAQMRKRILSGRAVAKTIAHFVPNLQLIPEFFKIRKFDYGFTDQRPNVQFHDLDMNDNLNPSEEIAAHLKETPVGHLRYASLHSLSPFVEKTTRGKKSIPLEIQVEPWSPHLQPMYMADLVIYHAAKNQEDVIYDEGLIEQIRSVALTGVKEWTGISK